MHAIRAIMAPLVLAGVLAGCIYSPGPYSRPYYDPYPSYYYAPPLVLGFGFGFGYGYGHRCWHCGRW